MNFNVVTLMQEPSGAQRFYEVDELLPVDDKPTAPRVRGTVRLRRTNRGIWVSAGLDSEVPCDCVRCLALYTQPVHMEIEEEYLTHYELRDEAESAGDLCAESLAIDEDHVLDMTEAIEQHIALNLPMKPVCRPDCRGICSTCGTNLNNTPCGCDKRPIDSRWAPLADAALLVQKS